MTRPGLSMIMSLLALPALAWSAPASPGKVQADPPTEVAGKFTCRIPPGWNPSPEPPFSADIDKVYGLELIGPKAKSGVYARIAADYYAPGNKVHATADDFIRVVGQTKGGVRISGETSGPVEPAEFKGRKASRFKRKVFEFPEAPGAAKKVSVQQEYLVVPAKEGYFVIEYSAPSQSAAEQRRTFDAFLKSFSPLL